MPEYADSKSRDCQWVVDWGIHRPKYVVLPEGVGTHFEGASSVTLPLGPGKDVHQYCGLLQWGTALPPPADGFVAHPLDTCSIWVSVWVGGPAGGVAGDDDQRLQGNRAQSCPKPMGKCPSNFPAI